MRQIVLDTETTGLEVEEGHRIIEVGCVEVMGRRLTGNDLHLFINPKREVDAGAVAVHGITNEFLQDKPLFEDVAEQLLDYLKGAELVIHNAAFDVGFLDAEFQRWRSGADSIETLCTVTDTLAEARRRHPGQRNSLDALCKRYEIDNSQRDLHGALLDAQLLAEVYLGMTGGQIMIDMESAAGDESADADGVTGPSRVTLDRRPPVVRASADEAAAHEAFLDMLEQAGARSLWREQAG
ncbi:MAG: DNA polymerase III subunit epsilon [Salinisphaeraceae bacterium]|nr:DNA polymerase III subunit epsilon [Salinisphaeraceae bacterium]